MIATSLNTHVGSQFCTVILSGDDVDDIDVSRIAIFTSIECIDTDLTVVKLECGKEEDNVKLRST